jgi:RNA recognition motif-containing protein
MDKAKINDRPIKVSLKRPTHARYTPEGVKVFIGSLNFSTSNERIREVVEKIARVKRIELPVDKESGRKGCAFVTVANMDDANQVIDQLNGFSLDGRRIIVELAKKKK